MPHGIPGPIWSLGLDTRSRIQRHGLLSSWREIIRRWAGEGTQPSARLVPLPADLSEAELVAILSAVADGCAEVGGGGWRIDPWQDDSGQGRIEAVPFHTLMARVLPRPHRNRGLRASETRRLAQLLDDLLAGDSSRSTSGVTPARAEQAEETPTTSEGRCPIAVTKSGSVSLFGREDSPIVNDREKPTLTNAQYDVVLALLQTGDKGLTKDGLDRGSRRGDARKILKRLSDSDSDWQSVISFPGTTGKGYRIV